jgi:glycosyltransferase involved in cell wall biosynthesis
MDIKAIYDPTDSIANQHTNQSLTQRRIVIVANTTWNIYNFRLNIIRKLISEGNEVIVMAPVDKFISYTENIPEVVHIPIRHLHRDSVNPIRDIRLLFELIGLYKKHKPDLILHYTVKPNIYGGLAARILGIPSMAVVTGLGYSLMHEGWINMITRLLYKLTLPLHQKVIFENMDDKAMFEKEHLVSRHKSLSIKGCGVDTQLFSPNGSLEESSVTTFTFIGRLLYDKGVKEFIEAAQLVKKHNPQVQFWLIGEIDKENPSSIRHDDLMKWIRDPDIHYHGATENIRKFIEKSDCVVLPSYREGMPRVIMEAMSMARPVITTDTAGCRETIEDQVSGFLIPVKDSVALAQAMNDFIALDSHAKKLMGQAGREKVLREFDDKIIADRLYDMLINVNV